MEVSLELLDKERRLRDALAPIVDARGGSEEAEALLRRALVVFEQELRAGHHEVAVVLHNLGAPQHKRGDLHGADRSYRRSLEAREATLGLHHPERATTLVNLGVLESQHGRLVAAEAVLDRAVRLLEPLVQADHATLVAAHEERRLVRGRAGRR